MEKDMETIQRLINTVMDFFVNYSFQVVGAFIILIAGIIVSRIIASFLLRLFDKKHLDVTLSKFVASTIKGIIIGFAIIIALGKFGITIAPFVAALAAMAFGASFAIQGPLANYGAGLSIILTRPFVVGNTITVAEVNGVVEEIKLGATILKDEDGVVITIPNKHIVGEIVHNSEKNKIVEETIGISYDADPEQAIQIIQKTLNTFQEITKEPPPQIGVQEFGDSSVNIGFRYWIPSTKYFDILYGVNLAVYKNFKESDIDIPFPQRVVHMAAPPTGNEIH
jgi:small conductance mechanosensitive channel